MDLGTILVPLDGTETASAALPYAEAIASAAYAPLQLFSAVESQWTEPHRSSQELRDYLQRFERDSLRGYLRSTANALQGRGVQASTFLGYGEATEEILAAAADSDVGMVTMATHGRGGIHRWLVGSVADEVMRLATRPTLLVRAHRDTLAIAVAGRIGATAVDATQPGVRATISAVYAGAFWCLRLPSALITRCKVYRAARRSSPSTNLSGRRLDRYTTGSTSH